MSERRVFEPWERSKPTNTACTWCGEGFGIADPTNIVDGDRMHLWCAAEDADNATFDRDMGD